MYDSIHARQQQNNNSFEQSCLGHFNVRVMYIVMNYETGAWVQTSTILDKNTGMLNP